MRNLLSVVLAVPLAACTGPVPPRFASPATAASLSAPEAARPPIAEVLANADPLAGAANGEAEGESAHGRHDGGGHDPGRHDGHTGHGGHGSGQPGPDAGQRK